MAPPPVQNVLYGQEHAKADKEIESLMTRIESKKELNDKYKRIETLRAEEARLEAELKRKRPEDSSDAQSTSSKRTRHPHRDNSSAPTGSDLRDEDMNALLSGVTAQASASTDATPSQPAGNRQPVVVPASYEPPSSEGDLITEVLGPDGVECLTLDQHPEGMSSALEAMSSDLEDKARKKLDRDRKRALSRDQPRGSRADGSAEWLNECKRAEDCVREKLQSRGTSYAVQGTEFACRGCFNKGRLCLRYDHSEKVFQIVPLPPIIRELSGDEGMNSYIYPEANQVINMEARLEREIWVD